MVSLTSVWCHLQHVKMAAPSTVLGVVVVVVSSGSSPRLMADRISVCNSFSRFGCGVAMSNMCLFSLFSGLCVVCENSCDWEDLRLSRARCLITWLYCGARGYIFLPFLSQNILQGFRMAWVNVALVEKRLEAIRSPSARRSCMVSALSGI